MKHRITASALARQLGDVLNRVRYRGDTFIVERHKVPVARIEPAGPSRPATVADALRAWRGDRKPDPSFADDLERVNAADQPPENPWDS